MNSRKQSLASIALLSALAFASINIAQPKPAHAIVGLATGGVPTMIVGGSLMGLGALLMGASVYVCDQDMKAAKNGWEALGVMLVLCPADIIVIGGPGAAVGLAGIIVLDSSGSASFNELTPEQEDKIGLTADERKAYSADLPDLNAAFQSNQAALLAEFRETGKISLEDAKAEWKETQKMFSPLTFSAAEKVAVAAMSKK